MMKAMNCKISTTGSFYIFTQVRFAGLYCRAIKKRNCPSKDDWIR